MSKGLKATGSLNNQLKGLNCMEHRGGCGGDSDSGDGAGILCSIPWGYLEEKINLKNTKEFNRGLGMVFMPNKKEKIKYVNQFVMKKQKN